MKKNILLLVSIICTGYLFSQPRVNRPKLSFDKESEILTKAIGWSYNSNIGEWIDYENVISANKSYKTKQTSSSMSYMMSHTPQNFLKIQTKTVSHNDITYYVVIVDCWDGQYEYPEIYEDWYTYKNTNGYIFTEKEYSKIKNIDSIVVLKTDRYVSLRSRYVSFDNTTFLDYIQTELSREKSYSTECVFPILKSEEGNIRFLVPHRLHSYDRKFDDKKFENQYFETSKENFSKIIIEEIN